MDLKEEENDWMGMGVEERLKPIRPPNIMESAGASPKSHHKMGFV